VSKNLDFKKYLAEVEREANLQLRDSPSHELLAWRLATASLNLQAADRLIVELERWTGDLREQLREAMEDGSRLRGDSSKLMGTALEQAIARLDAEQSLARAYLQKAALEPLAAKGEKFKPRGRGAGKMRKLIEQVMTGDLMESRASDLWNACSKSPRATKLGIEFGASNAWVKGEGNVGFPRFRNLVSEVRKVKRTRRSE